MDMSSKWTQYQRRVSQKNSEPAPLPCHVCPEHPVFNEADLWAHARTAHAGDLQLEGKTAEELADARKRFVEDAVKNRIQPQTPKRPFGGQMKKEIADLQELTITTPRTEDSTEAQHPSDEGQAPYKRRNFGSGISAGSGSPYRASSSSPPQERSKPRPNSSPALDEQRRPKSGKERLWTPDRATSYSQQGQQLDPQNVATIKAAQVRAKAFQQQQTFATIQATNLKASVQANVPSPKTIKNAPRPSQSHGSANQVKEEGYSILLQPETRAISQEQLVAEVKGIYAGLVMVEAKCIDVDTKQAALANSGTGPPPNLSHEQWQALIALHRTLLHEHHDFFLASQHPSASAALRRLANKYAMPARMWRHGIHSFLELLRHRLPASLDHMLAFIYLAYSMMALLYETVPAFEDTWIECLGDLARYRMAIEEEDIRDREVWTSVARFWYSKASDKSPNTGRLFHHLAILARPNAILQLFFYTKSLCVTTPFTSARESILTLFEPLLGSENTPSQYRLPALDTSFVKIHAHLFTNNMEGYEQTLQQFCDLLDGQIGRVTRKFMDQGYQIAIANGIAMLGYATQDNVLMKALTQAKKGEGDITMSGSPIDSSPSSMALFKNARHLSNVSVAITLRRIGDPNVLPFIHVTLAFMYCMAQCPAAMYFLQAEFPWKALAGFLNTLLISYETFGRIESGNFPLPEKDDYLPFPEDFALRGLLWTETYYPKTWFTNEKIDEEEKYFERASMTPERKERILWLACNIAKLGPWILYDGARFSVPQPDIESSHPSRTSTFASATTAASTDSEKTEMTLGRAETWESETSTADKDIASPVMPAAETLLND